MKMTDGWSVVTIRDGKGYSYTAEQRGRLVASGWFLCTGPLTRARAIALELSKLAQERQ